MGGVRFIGYDSAGVNTLLGSIVPVAYDSSAAVYEPITIVPSPPPCTLNTWIYFSLFYTQVVGKEIRKEKKKEASSHEG